MITTALFTYILHLMVFLFIGFGVIMAGGWLYHRRK